MRRLRLRGILLAALTIGCLMPAATGSALAVLTSARSLASNTFTAGYWTCVAGSAVLSTLQDTYVDAHSPDTNYGSATTLVVNSAGDKESRMLLQFSSLPPIPTGCAFKTATLAVYTSTAKPGLTYNIYNLDAPWVGGTVTWNNQPAPAGSTVSVPTAGAVGPTTWTVTALVAAQYGGTPNNGFVVEDPASGPGYSHATNYESNESGATVPTLTITWGP